MLSQVKKLLATDETTYSIAKHSGVPEQTVRNLRNNITSGYNTRYRTIENLYHYANEVLDMELYGVKFTDREQYEAVKIGIESSAIEGFEPTEESVRHIKSVLEGSMTIAELAELHRQREQHTASILK